MEETVRRGSLRYVDEVIDYSEEFITTA